MLKSQQLARVGGYFLLGALAVLTALPFVYLFKLSVQPERDILQIPIKIIPSALAWQNYQLVFARLPLARQMWNTFVYASVSAILSVMTGSMAAYALAKLRLRGARWMLGGFLATILFPPATRAIPLYALMAQWGWIDTWQGLILPMASNGVAIFFLYQYLLTLPDELCAVARLDGASEGRIFVLIILPLAQPALAIMLFYLFLLRWNDVIWPLLMTKGHVTTLPVGLAALKDSAGLIPWNIIGAAMMFSFVPSLGLFLRLRRHIMQPIGRDLK
jgi:multiple sugar transport system permease protein